MARSLPRPRASESARRAAPQVARERDDAPRVRAPLTSRFPGPRPVGCRPARGRCRTRGSWRSPCRVPGGCAPRFRAVDDNLAGDNRLLASPRPAGGPATGRVSAWSRSGHACRRGRSAPRAPLVRRARPGAGWRPSRSAAAPGTPRPARSCGSTGAVAAAAAAGQPSPAARAVGGTRRDGHVDLIALVHVGELGRCPVADHHQPRVLTAKLIRCKVWLFRPCVPAAEQVF